MPILAFSDQAFRFMANSDFFCPPIYEVPKGNLSLDDVFQNRKLVRRRIPFIDEAFRGTARLIYIIAVDVLATPAGLLYHGCQLLRRKIEIRFITQKINSPETKKNHVIHKEQEELLQAAIHEELLRFNAVKRDMFFVITLIMGLAILKPFRPYAISGISRLESYPLLKGFVHYLKTCTLATSVGSLLMHVAFSVFASMNPAKAANVWCENDSDVKQGMQLRREFNRMKGFTSSQIFNNRVDRLTKCLTELQRALPKDLKMPCDFKYPLKGNVLDWIEEQKNILIEQRTWEQIEPLASSFATIHDQVEDAAFYGDGSLQERLLKAALAVESGETIVHTTARQRDLAIGAFSLELFKKMCGSNLCYPSQSELIKSESLLNTVMNDKNVFLNRKKISHWTHTLKTPFCLAARAIAFIAIGLIGAPMGLLYHALQGTRFYTKYLLSRMETTKYKNWEKMLGHISALWVDASFAFSGGGFFDVKTIIMKAPILLTALYALPLNKILNKIRTQGIAYSIPVFALGAFFSPISIIPWLAYRDERIALFKAIISRHLCGYAGINGQLLPYNKTPSPSAEFDPDLVRFWVESSREVLVVLNEVSSLLSAAEHSQFVKCLAGNAVNYDAIIQLLKKKVSANRSDKSVGAIIVSNENTHIINNVIDRLKILKEAMTELQWAIGECYTLVHYDFFENSQKRIFLPQFPFPLDNLITGFSSEAEIDSEWKQIVIRERIVIKTSQLKIPEKPSGKIEQRLKKLADLISKEEPTVTPEMILEVSSQASREEINREFRKKASCFHPDNKKIPKEFVETAVFFFRIISEAKEQLLKKASQSHNV